MSADVWDNEPFEASRRNAIMQMTVPTILTLLRIALVPVLVLFFYLPYGKLAHLVYRTLAMAYAHYSGREPCEDQSGGHH